MKIAAAGTGIPEKSPVEELMLNRARRYPPARISNTGERGRRKIRLSDEIIVTFSGVLIDRLIRK
jgi:hypothetical protein